MKKAFLSVLLFFALIGEVSAAPSQDDDLAILITSEESLHLVDLESSDLSRVRIQNLVLHRVKASCAVAGFDPLPDFQYMQNIGTQNILTKWIGPNDPQVVTEEQISSLTGYFLSGSEEWSLRSFRFFAKPARTYPTENLFWHDPIGLLARGRCEDKSAPICGMTMMAGVGATACVLGCAGVPVANIGCMLLKACPIALSYTACMSWVYYDDLKKSYLESQQKLDEENAMYLGKFLALPWGEMKRLCASQDPSVSGF